LIPGAVGQWAPWEVLVCCLALMIAPVVASQQRSSSWLLLGAVATLLLTLFSPDGPRAYIAATLAALLHAAAAADRSRTGAAGLLISAAFIGSTGVALHQGYLTMSFVLSCTAIALRAGVMPLHAGVASLCDRAVVVQVQQLASTIALVFIHLRFVDHHPGAIALAPAVVRIGAAMTLVPALMATVQRDLRGLYRTSTAMHGGMLLAALGAASLDNYAAALLVAVTLGLALGGLGLMLTSLEERVGPVQYSGPGGRIQAFPRLAACFVIFGAAGVGLPGTAGFVADDLLLHTLWLESPASAAMVIVASALLAVSTLVCFARVFLGPATRSVAPDLVRREALAGVLLLALLLVLGVVPGVLLGPADAWLSDVGGRDVAVATRP
jgi:NADH-quinone oxidoreductase subunit M